MYIYFYTFGCKVNVYETAALSEAFEKAGYAITREKALADIFIINSCTVTSESDSKVMQTLRRIKREYPSAITVLTGCYPQAFPEKAEKCCADIITGTKDRAETVALVNRFMKNKQKLSRIVPYESCDGFEAMTVKTVEGHTRAFMKIQDGCNAFCTYCIIPYSRGRLRSMPIDDVRREAELLAENGYKEIVLVGINLAFYGTETGLRLADAAETVCSVKGIERVRLSSLEPEMITESDLIRLKAQPKFCPSFHLSLQSGCNKTLKAMNRRYTAEEYEELVTLIRKMFPDCGITADIMTGFPGETEDDHITSMRFAEKIGFSDINVFPYSGRAGTKADKMENQIPADIRKRRAAQMSAVGKKCRDKFLGTLVGKEFPVLFEREKADGIHHGYAPNYTHIKILTKYSDKSLRKMIFYVKIDKIEDGCCIGHILPQQNVRT